jgi:hypothetical protein
MASPVDVDRQSRLVWLMLVILGMVLAVVAWFRVIF